MVSPEDVFSKVLHYFEKIDRMVNSFVNAINSLNKLDLNNAYKNLADSIRLDTEADELRREVFALISRYISDVTLRESISKLLRMMDRLTEWIKEAARYLDILPYLEIPQEIKNEINELARLDSEACKRIKDAAQALFRKRFDDAIALALEVEKIEEKADEVNHAARRSIVQYGNKIANPAILIMLRDFIEALENATDYAEDVADMIRLIAQYLKSTSKA